MQLSLFVVVLLVALASASRPEDWTKLSRAGNEQTTMRFHVALKQRNLDELTRRVLDMSDPESPNFSQHMTKEEVLDLIAPEKHIVDGVVAFFKGFKGVSVTNYGDALKVIATTKAVEEIFDTTVFEFAHKTGIHSFRQRGGATIPEEIKEHVDVITGLTAFPIIPDTLDLKKKPTNVDDDTYNYVSTSTIRNLYGIPPGTKAKNKNIIQSILEFLPVGGPEFDDLQQFARLSGDDFTNITKIIGNYDRGQQDGESTLDIQLITGIAQKAVNWYWSIADGWVYEAALEVFSHKEGRPQVVSVSYGWPEIATCQTSVTNAKCHNNDYEAYIARANVELEKTVALGITWSVSSGDQGAAGNLNTDCFNTQHPIYGVYPGSSPWVTTLSATTVIGGGSTKSPEICNKFYDCTTATLEHPCMFNNTYFQWTTGGGFSEVTPAPKWQQKAIADYRDSTAKFPPRRFWHPENIGYPDVSTVGSRILIVQDGSVNPSAGTSASAPIFAAIVTLLNDARMSMGKKPLGFLNPILYKMGEKQDAYFNDITIGSNRCTEGGCCEYGYYTAKGWDAVSGWGSPKFEAMLDYVTKLP